MIEDGRARGTAKLAQPGEFFDNQYNFELSFDVSVLGGRVASSSEPIAALIADSHEGLPVPEENQGLLSEGSRFHTTSMTSAA